MIMASSVPYEWEICIHDGENALIIIYMLKHKKGKMTAVANIANEECNAVDAEKFPSRKSSRT